MGGCAFAEIKKGEECAAAEASLRLVGGEGERRRRRGALVWVCAALAVLALASGAWLLALTQARQQAALELEAAHAHLQRLQTAVDSLTAWADKQRTLLTDINAYDDGVFAELDVDSEEGQRPRPRHPSTLTADDEDLLYDEDGESGWYHDYDERKQVGESGMERLSAAALVGKLRTGPAASPAPARVSKLSQVRQLLREVESRREHESAHGAAGVAGVEEAAGVARDRRGRSVRDQAPAQDSLQLQHSLFSSWTGAIQPDAASPPRPDNAERSRYSRQNEVTPDFMAAHFHGNTSHMTAQTHPHYKGNGLVQLPHDAAHGVWWPAEWTRRTAHPNAPVLTRRGHLRVRHSAIYLVYVQIYYLDAHDSAGWVLHRQRGETREALLQCAATAPAPAPHLPLPPLEKPNSCFSAAALRLARGDALAVRNTGGDRHALMQPEKSFIGLVKLADDPDPPDDDEDFYT